MLYKLLSYPGKIFTRIQLMDEIWGLIADFWYENHCSVLYVEQRGQNKSGGEYMGFGLLERYDCLEWIKWVNENTDGKTPIYLAGVSMGASTVMMAGGLELPDNKSRKKVQFPAFACLQK